MTVFLHELKRNRLMLGIWSAVTAFMLALCIFIYPEMQSEMDALNGMLENMGALSDAFGLDQLNFAEFMGYFGMECGEILGLGGSILAAILGVNAIAGEERGGTAEFLFTHPLSKMRIVTEKMLSVAAMLVIMIASVAAVTTISVAVIDVDADASELALLFLANLCLDIEIAAITLCLSSFIDKGGMGIGIGICFGLYFLNLIANITEAAEFLKFITPFGYTDGSYIVNENAISIKYLSVGLVITVISIFVTYKKYLTKDIK